MSALFTVRWPLFARLEAVLLFPAVTRLASEIEPVRTYVNERMVPVVSPVGTSLGVPGAAMFWAGMALAVTVPYFIALLIADRFLTVRKGFALLSLVAIGIWAAAGFHLSFLLADVAPRLIPDGTGWLSSNDAAALVVGGLALLAHLRALWVGSRDQGEIAEHLVARQEEYTYRPPTRAQQLQDVYYRQTADFRGWRGQRQPQGRGPGPRENPAVKFLWGITWAGVIVGLGTAYFSWNGLSAFSPGPVKREPTPVAAAAPLRPVAVVAPGTSGTSPVVRIAPIAPPPAVQTATSAPQPAVHTAAMVPMPLPAVQRPTDLSASVAAGDIIGGPNEAVAERGGDGGFAFDAVVNGTHLRMLFDTGASVVGLRAEDAARLGIPVSRLNYAVTIKTANGTAEVAPVMLDTMVIGNITLRNVAGFVAKQGMLQENLLGQTFLARLSGFNVERNLLVLRGR